MAIVIWPENLRELDPYFISSCCDLGTTESDPRQETIVILIYPKITIQDSDFYFFDIKKSTYR